MTTNRIVATSLARSRSALREIKAWARLLKREVHAIYLAAQSLRVPWYTKCLAMAVAGYALSPIDLIPDFIPVLGYVDDLIIVPLGIRLVLALIPDEVMTVCRARANESVTGPHGKIAAIVFIAIRVLGGAMLGWSGFVCWRGTKPARKIEPSHAGDARNVCACAISRATLPLAWYGICRPFLEGELKWPGRLRKSSKCR